MGRCSACTCRIRLGSRRTICWSCKAQKRLSCKLSNRTQIVRTQMIQRWQCTRCSNRPVADGDYNRKPRCQIRKALINNNLNSVFFNGAPTASIENNNVWKISLRLIMWTLCVSKRQSSSQMTRLLNSETAVLPDVIDQCKWKRAEEVTLFIFENIFLTKSSTQRPTTQA